MSTFPFRMPEDIRDAVAEHAARAGVSMNQYLLSIVAARVGAQGEAERSFAARAERSSPSRARAVLARAGANRPPEPGDEMPRALAARLAARKASRKA